ncbi:hypothetical protein K1T71_009525 [Dendrolimus kikuchii]|uniref:Uncharacterized protein n=1 Tax=Dendrolimus kikuchii TaxID=765133 RepID=A0ACC1CT46_9NEOP|nr:hypothetical protein K1T71_009525 [Dendrolimus kikuchii]
MLTAPYLWLLLCYAQYARSNLLEDYEELSDSYITNSEDQTNEILPNELGKDKTSGCICRGNKNYKFIVCFGNYECRKFPRVKIKSEVLRVRTTVIVQLLKGEIDSLYYLNRLDIEANHQLTYIEPGTFRNLTNLQQLSISYNTNLRTINDRTFEGLDNLRNLTLVNNGFTNILMLTPAFKPIFLPALQALDLSENALEIIPEDAFYPMRGSTLGKLHVDLCTLDYIHPNTFLPLKNLKELDIGENELNSSIIGQFLIRMTKAEINLIRLDLSGMGFRKQPPRNLMDIIAKTTIKSLNLAQNQFEIIDDDCFPKMINIEVLDLRKVLAITIGPNTFEPMKFPNLKVLLLSGNNLPGIHRRPLSDQLLVLDMSNNKGTLSNPMYYEIDRDTFLQSRELRILNIAFNRIRSIFDYSFRGLDNLRILNMENGTLYHIGNGSFKPLRRLQVLNLANNPLAVNDNLTSLQFEGLNALKVLILENCGIKRLYDDDNIFEMMPNLTNLLLKNNQLFFITAETLKPLKFLQRLDLSQNLLISWWKPLFLASGVKPITLYLTNNKISHFSISMIQDIGFLLENTGNHTVDIDLMDNIFICDCSSMYKTYLWLQVNGTAPLKQYFSKSKFQCSSPDLWEDRRVADYLSSIKTVHCLMYEKISNVMLLIWTAPSLITIALVVIIVVIIYKYRMYIHYWMFLAKIALGRNFRSKPDKSRNLKTYKYDAFVSYCNDDREFVIDMISELETKPPYLKLCVFERDFEIGSFISESVHSCINESKFVILVISNSFAKSQWCRWETQLAEYHRIFLEDGTSYDPLVLIKIDEVQSKYLTTTLKFLLKTKIYHTWNENKQEEFWKKLRNVLDKMK